MLSVSNPRFLVNKNGTNQTGLTSATDNLLTWGNIVSNIGGYFGLTANKWTPPAGKVRIGLQAYGTGTIALNAIGGPRIYKNAAAISVNVFASFTNAGAIVDAVIEDVANGSDTYHATLYLTGSSLVCVGNTVQTYFWGYWFSP